MFSHFPLLYKDFQLDLNTKYCIEWHFFPFIILIIFFSYYHSCSLCRILINTENLFFNRKRSFIWGKQQLHQSKQVHWNRNWNYCMLRTFIKRTHTSNIIYILYFAFVLSTTNCECIEHYIILAFLKLFKTVSNIKIRIVYEKVNC